MCMLSCFSCVWLIATPWTVACQALPSVEFSRQEYGNGFLCPPPGHLPDPGIKLASRMSPALVGGFFTTSATWEAHSTPRNTNSFTGFLERARYILNLFSLLCSLLPSCLLLANLHISSNSCSGMSLLTPQWNCFFDLLSIAFVTMIIHDGLPQRILPLCLTIKVPLFRTLSTCMHMAGRKKLTHLLAWGLSF